MSELDMTRGMNRNSGYAMTERDHILQSLEKLIMTPVGSRLHRRSYGSVVPMLLDQPLNSAAMLRVTSAIATAIMVWEPRVTLRAVNLQVVQPAGLEITLRYALGDDVITTRMALNGASYSR